jgi:hypothetical protein
MVDVAINDENGRKFWKDNFLKKEEVSWKEFIDRFLKFVPASDQEYRTINVKCLQSVLGKFIS